MVGNRAVFGPQGREEVSGSDAADGRFSAGSGIADRPGELSKAWM